MKLIDFKYHLSQMDASTPLQIQTPSGSFVPLHFHITEVALEDKRYIDCGGTPRHEQRVGFQLWVAGDTEHRLAAQKLLGIIKKAQLTFPDIDDTLPIQIQYQMTGSETGTIGLYDLGIDGGVFQLQNLLTNCLAPDQCGVSPEQLPASSAPAAAKTSCCGPKSCC